MISARIYGEGYGVAIMERTGKGRMEMKCLPVAIQYNALYTQKLKPNFPVYVK